MHSFCTVTYSKLQKIYKIESNEKAALWLGLKSTKILKLDKTKSCYTEIYKMLCIIKIQDIRQ